jgi:hypothetical protein
MGRYTGRRQYLQRSGYPTYWLIRYADDVVVTREQAQALLSQLAGRVEARCGGARKLVAGWRRISRVSDRAGREAAAVCLNGSKGHVARGKR